MEIEFGNEGSGHWPTLAAVVMNDRGGWMDGLHYINVVWDWMDG
jgi:hypothetical protein